MKISYYILISFAAIMLLFAATTYINIHLSRKVNENAAFQARSTKIIRSSNQFQRNILTIANGLRGYLLTGQNSFIDSYDSATIENNTILVTLAGVVTDSIQRSLLREINALNNQWTEEFTEPIKQAKMLANASPENLQTYNLFYREKFASGHERRLHTALQEKFKAFTLSEYNIREMNSIRLKERLILTDRLSIFFTVVSVIIAAVIIIFLLVKFSQRINQITNMSNAISAGNYDVTISESISDELSPLRHSLNHMVTELSRNISLLRRSNEELEQFAHIVSHDLKGPLRGIGNVVSWIEEDHTAELTPRLEEYLQLIKGRVIRAENLIAGLLSYARADKEEIEKENVDLNLLTEEVLENLPQHSHIQINIDPLPTLYTEKILLFQIFSNLLSNAIKYNDKQSGEVKVYFTEDESVYEFFVADNGKGIAAQYHKRIFIIFQTLKENEQSDESTGVGLAIVQKIVNSKNQQIRLQSVPGEGSVFSFTWPKK
jgi:signal transduction histidine kinase